MAKYLINDKEADVLRNLVKGNKLFDRLGWSDKTPRTGSNFPFRFKLKETMGATTAHKANAAIWYFGDSTAHLFDTDFVVDDSSALTGATSGTKGVCLASSLYHILNTGSVGSTATKYMCLASTSYASSDLTIVMDTLQPMNGTGTTLTTLNAYNKFAWNILNDGECCIEYNQYSSRYELIQTKCT